MSASVESWSWQCLCVCVCVYDLVFFRGRCIRWMFVVASAKCSACQSVFFLFSFATIVRSPLTLRAVPRAATLSETRPQESKDGTTCSLRPWCQPSLHQHRSSSHEG